MSGRNDVYMQMAAAHFDAEMLSPCTSVASTHPIATAEARLRALMG